MKFIDGYLNFVKLSEQEFIDESTTWKNNGIICVICDNSEEAISDLSNKIIEKNLEYDREVKIFNALNDKIQILKNKPSRVPYFSDKIFDWMWIEAVNEPVQDTNDYMSFEFIRKTSKEIGFYSLFFFNYPPYIEYIDKNATQIVLDYTKSFGGNNSLHIEMKRECSIYYIYDQENNYFYKFKQFSKYE
jgi:hypothetical protein